MVDVENRFCMAGNKWVQESDDIEMVEESFGKTHWDLITSKSKVLGSALCLPCEDIGATCRYVTFCSDELVARLIRISCCVAKQLYTPRRLF